MQLPEEEIELSPKTNTVLVRFYRGIEHADVETELLGTNVYRDKRSRVLSVRIADITLEEIERLPEVCPISEKGMERLETIREQIKQME